MTTKHHRFSGIWPLMARAAYDDLKADIRANGLRLPILTYQGQVLDGRNRQRACEETGVPARYEPVTVASEADALKLVVSLNQHRRHLSLKQRAFAAARLANLTHGTNRFSNIIEVSRDTSIVSVEKAAKMLDVSTASIKRAKSILKHGGEAAAADVLAGGHSLKGRCEAIRPKAQAKLKPPKRAKPGRPRKDEGRPVFTRNVPAPRALTRQEVDPEFTGTGIEWVDKYGHVQIHTAAEYATARFGAWASNMKAVAKEARRLPDWPQVDHNWLRNPLAYDITKLAEALEFLEPKIAEARALLKRAQEAPTPVARANGHAKTATNPKGAGRPRGVVNAVGPTSSQVPTKH